MKLLEYKNYLVSWLQEEVKKANMDGVIVGLSGGVDSSVVAAIAKEAFPNNSLGVIMPINKMNQDYVDAMSLANQIKIETIEVNLFDANEAIVKQLSLTNKLAIANIKPRLRMTTLYALAQEKRYLVLGTDNAAEWILGYFTKYGDGGADLLPIINLLKRDVTKLAHLLNLPQNIYTKKPTAALWEGQSDEDELGFSYDFVDEYILGKTIPKNIKTKIEWLHKITEHKRNKLPQPKKFH